MSLPTTRRVAASVLGLVRLLAGPAGAADGPGASLFDGTACDLLPLEELDALGPLVYDDASPGLDTCLYASGDEAGGHRVELSRSSATIEDMRNFFAGGEDLTISGHDAYASAGRLGVQTDEGLLEVVASLAEDAASADLGIVAYETAIAEVILARLAGVALSDGDAPADGPTSARSHARRSAWAS